MNNDFILNESQMRAVRDTEGAVLVIAGAGSGKTRVLTARICHLAELGVDPYNILAITFTNKAAAEMKQRIAEALGNDGAVWTSTFHSLCARILRVDGEILGYTKDFSIYTDIESDRVVKRVAAEISGADPKKKGEYLWHISAAKTAALSPEAYYEAIKNDVNGAAVITLVYRAYESELKRSNALDFDDLLLKTVELFDNYPDVLDKYRRRFRYINVDEFQDTNRLQYKLVRQLASEHGNVFVVGDEDQSIYSWRGAEIRNILDFSADFPEAKIYKLEQNYRSTTSILEAANNVIKHNTARNKKTLWSENDCGNCVEYFEASSDREEAAYVSRQINWLVSRGESYRDIAVLVRVNSLTRTFEEDFNLYGIPYKVFGGFRFFERKEIKDALAYVRLALNPSDNDSLLRIINYPRRGIGNTAVKELTAVAAENGITYFSVLINPGFVSPATAKKLAPFLSVAEDLHAASVTMKPVEFMRYVIVRSGLFDALSQSGDADDQNRLENIEELVNAVTAFTADNPDATMSDFMQSVSLVSDSDEMDGDNYVTLATIHAVKGLEFDTVFTVGLEEGIFPVSRAMQGGDVEEERRLMYVAITRARKAFYATSARSRFRFGETVYNPVSRFIAEMRGDKSPVRLTGSSYEIPAKGSTGRELKAYSGSFKTATEERAVEGGADFNAFQKDVVVEHAKFGRGIIISTTGEGSEKTAAIAFKGLGVKRFSLIIAASNLKIVKE